MQWDEACSLGLTHTSLGICRNISSACCMGACALEEGAPACARACRAGALKHSVCMMLARDGITCSQTITSYAHGSCSTASSCLVRALHAETDDTPTIHSHAQLQSGLPPAHLRSIMLHKRCICKAAAKPAGITVGSALAIGCSAASARNQKYPSCCGRSPGSTQWHKPPPDSFSACCGGRAFPHASASRKDCSTCGQCSRSASVSNVSSSGP